MRTPDDQSATPRTDIRSEPVRESRSSEETYPDKKAGRIADVSPEGRPANPDLGPSGIVKLMIAAMGVVLLASGLTWAVVGPDAALGLLIVGLLLAIVVNPVIYASALRAKERGQVENTR
jgi:hypothetical protein